MIRNFALATAAAALVSVPIGASAVERAVAPIEGEARLNGDGTLFLVATIAVVAAAVVLLPDEPASP